MRRFPLAFVLVGLMSLLAAGGALLGVFEAPTGDELTVHNGAGETLQATRVVGTYASSESSGSTVSFVFTAPDHLSEKAIGPSGKVEAHRSLTGPQALAVLQPVQGLLSIGRFSTHGSYYDNTRPARDLVAPSQRAGVTGTYRTRVEIAGGYVVGVLIHIDAKDGTQHIDASVDYRYSRIDGWTHSG